MQINVRSLSILERNEDCLMSIHCSGEPLLRWSFSIRVCSTKCRTRSTSRPPYCFCHSDLTYYPCSETFLFFADSLIIKQVSTVEAKSKSRMELEMKVRSIVRRSSVTTEEHIAVPHRWIRRSVGIRRPQQPQRSVHRTLLLFAFLKLLFTQLVETSKRLRNLLQKHTRRMNPGASNILDIPRRTSNNRYDQSLTNQQRKVTRIKSRIISTHHICY